MQGSMTNGTLASHEEGGSEIIDGMALPWSDGTSDYAGGMEARKVRKRKSSRDNNSKSSKNLSILDNLVDASEVTAITV